MRRINEEILKCEMTLLGMELEDEESWKTRLGEDEESWKTRLGQVRDLVDAMCGEWYFEATKGTLNRVIGKIIRLNISDERDWGVLHSLIDQCLVAFGMLKYMPIKAVQETFEALHNGLNSKFVKTDVWMKIKEKIKKDETIHIIMKSLGEAIQKIPDDNIVAIVGKDGLVKMKLISKTLE